MESGVEFVAADMPTVNRLTVHILAAVAEEEARMISARTKAALVAAKARGIRLGNPGLVAGSAAQARAANAVKTGRAQARAAEVLPFIEQAHQAGALTLQQIANALAARGVPTPSGRSPRWHPVQVARIVGSAYPGFRFRKVEGRLVAGASLPSFLKVAENLEE